MAKAKPAKKSQRARGAKKVARKRSAKGRATAARRRARPEPLAPVKGAERRDAGGVQLEICPAGSARVKRVVYPAGFRWSVDMKPLVGTDLCMHAHVGFLSSGAIRVEYPDGCTVKYEAPQVVAIEPGHDGAVVGDAPAVLIEFDFEEDTVNRLGMPGSHRHP
jgi:hypothetical protein